MPHTNSTNVIVTKAFALMRGETLSMATKALSDGARTHIQQKLGLPESVHMFMMEVMSKVAVFEIFEKDGSMRFVAVKFDRDGKTFKFGDVMEVERVTSFVPKAQFGRKRTLKREVLTDARILDGRLKPVAKSVSGATWYARLD